ncbi:hypothetical protein [Tanticharoenia sakaeratensis]|uniref:Uncharacterized protein n=1 Tax=Tanticharoenia sakaeratensis NBRC 103193 TaxID=1231623 RepID=A0A0D6MMU1_9PROT|nr:hypothetical protein [Tanticharoenia sakaeratensis]GAN54613.1 hypothetical protein Tasa_025_044 [Tanticharoenia sakaeratensis NBRC 103193]
MTAPLLLAAGGAFGIGTVVGWFLYFTNRYRRDVTFADVGHLLVALAGGASTAVFRWDGPTHMVIWGSYGLGIFSGFFGYFAVLLVLMARSRGAFSASYLIDGRSRLPGPGEGYAPGTEPPAHSFTARPEPIGPSHPDQ